MPAIPSDLLATALGLAATLAAIALLVQVVQEVYKHLTKSKARSYEKVIVDALGPWVRQVANSPSQVDMTVRGPLQFLRRRPQGVLLPMNANDLKTALERTAPDWERRTLEALRHEQKLQDGSAARPGASLREFLEGLGGEAADGDPTAGEVAAFLEERGLRVGSADDDADGKPGKQKSIDAAALATDFEQTFMPHVVDAVARYPRILENFEYAYGRRNLRQSVVFGLLLALAANLPLNRLYENAASLSPADATALYEQVSAQYETLQCAEGDTRDVCTDAEARLDGANELLATTLCGLTSDDAASGEDCPAVEWGFNVAAFDSVGAGALYVFWCLMTAFLLSFGAPFWHDLGGALARVGKRGSGSDGAGNGSDG